MADLKKIITLPPTTKPKISRVGIYCRVSSNSMEQLKSLTAQISGLTRFVAANPNWILADVYIDIASAKTGSSRCEFNRMLENCKSGALNIVLTKSISRFARDTKDLLVSLRELKDSGVRVIFEQENLDTEALTSELMITLVGAVAQAENESRSANIRWGIRHRMATGTSKLYNRVCYGYTHDKDGKLVIEPEEAKVVQMVFRLYLQGNSVIGILSELEKQGIPSPTGNAKWCKRTVDTMLSNEKYAGMVLLQDHGDQTCFLMENNHTAIISFEEYQAVKLEKARRSNVVKTDTGNERKHQKYSSKKR